ncbi:MAG: amidohydrolase family protein [Ignavibacteria bacterium]|nr:amidohydrolase family protein [Ignavibacteria bacterium]
MVKKQLTGIIINPKENGNVELVQNGLVEFDSETGKILKVGKSKEKSKKELAKEEFIIIPGLVDLHSHIPQLPGVAKNADELLPWLKNHIFPLEVKFSDLEYAARVSKFFFTEAISLGTTTIVAYASVHKEATDVAFEVAKEMGIRAFIGKVMMDRDLKRYPEELPLMSRNIKDSLDLAKKWHNSNNGMLQYIFSPRFAASCTMKLLEKTAAIAKEGDFFIQTHLAENQSEVKFIKSLFERERHRVPTNTHIFKKSDILGEKTLLAHCLYLSTPELLLIQESGSKIIHCPTSNIFLQSGFMPLRRYESYDIPIGFGTDVAGGYSLSMFNCMRDAIETTKIVNLINDNRPQPFLTPQEAFWKATLGGAKILNLDSKIGSIEIGKEADLVVIKPEPHFKFYNNTDDVESILENLIYLPHTYKIVNVFIAGKDRFIKNTN